MKPDKTIRILTGVACLLALLAVFIFQDTDVAGLLLGVDGKSAKFVINRVVRFFVNDLLAIGLIYALFYEKKYLVFSLWVQVTGALFFLLPYLILKLNFPGYNGPLISYLHRLMINPTLLLLLIPAFYLKKIGDRHGQKMGP